MPVSEVAVHVTSCAAWSGQARYAARLAARWQAQVTGVHVLPPLDSLSLVDDPQTLAALYAEQHRRQREAIDAKSSFDAFARTCGAPASRWCVAEGSVPESLAWSACGADLVVLAPGGDPENGRSELGRTVVDARMPCLIVPSEAAALEPTHARIVVAWNASVESWRALAAAMPFLREAQSIVLLDGSDQRTLPGPDLWGGPSLIAWLARHRIEAHRVPFDATTDDVGELLLARADDYNADLIVMGAYGRSRFAEWLLGGVTRHMLRHSPVPVLMHH